MPAPVRDSVASRIGAWSRRQTARALVKRRLNLHVTGLEYLPGRGPAWRFNREGYSASGKLLGDGRILLMFPEGYPNVDPLGTMKSESEACLPFDPGFLVLAEHSHCDVLLVPVGLSYAKRNAGGWSVWLRFGAPFSYRRAGRAEHQRLLARIEAAVRKLSIPPG